MPFNRRSSVTIKSPTSQRRIKPEPKPAVKQFIKIILFPASERKMLQIPQTFVKLGPKLFDIVTVETPVGFKRSIQIKRIGDKVWFDKGWNEFAEAHSLSEGYLLMFQYKENSNFSVVIFDVSASEIDYPEEKVYVIDSDDDIKEEVMDDGDEKGFTGFENLDDDKSGESIDLDEMLKTVNIKSEEVITLDDDDDEETEK